jgi:hypothetical protein
MAAQGQTSPFRAEGRKVRNRRKRVIRRGGQIVGCPTPGALTHGTTSTTAARGRGRFAFVA